MIGYDRTTGAVKHQQSTSKIMEVQPQGASAIAPAVSATSCMGISSSFRMRLFSSLFSVQHCQTASRMTANRNLALADKRARNSISSILCTNVQGMTRLLLLHISVVGLLWNLMCSNVWHCHGKWSWKLVSPQLSLLQPPQKKSLNVSYVFSFYCLFKAVLTGLRQQANKDQGVPK